MLMLRKITIFISSTLFRLVLFFGVSILVLIALYGNQDYIASVLQKNNAYERFIPAFLETNKEQPITAGGNTTLGTTDIQQSIINAFPSEFIQTNVEQTLDSTYRWLQGESPTLNFAIDLSQNESQLASNLADAAIDRLQTLPECATFSSATVDPFSTPCTPPFIDLEQEREALQAELLASTRLTEESIITPETFTDTNSTTFNRIPFYYSLARLAWLPLLLLLLLCAMAIIFASSTRKKGFRKIGYGLFSTGTSLVFFTVVFSFVIPSFTGSLPIFQTSQQGIDGLLNDVSLTLGRDYATTTILYSLPLVLLGGILILLTKQKKADKYQKLAKKAGLANSNAQQPKTITTRRAKPPIQSSEISSTKPQKSKKHKKYRTIPKKEV
jgi:hypothetical protein